VLGGALLALTACDGAGLGGGPAAPERAATLVVARPTDSVSLDPARVTDTESAEVNLLLYDTLVRHRAETGELAPSLAVAWTVDDAGTTWTFQLRPGVRFSDGTPVDAAAVVWNVARQIDEGHPDHHGHFAVRDTGRPRSTGSRWSIG
jgi:peptide/nickel transport system substrate-binding protein